MTRDVPSYDAGVFADPYRTNLGQALWKCLNEPDVQVRMETASDLGRPALEGIENLLLERFGIALVDERVKQMAGHMTRQVMESRGYVMDAQNVKMSGAPFSRATRYRKADRPGDLVFHVWRAVGAARTFALTPDRTGERLLAVSPGKWVYWKCEVGALRACIALGIADPAGARSVMERQGFYMHERKRIMRAARAATPHPMATT